MAFWVETNHQSLGARVVSYAAGHLMFYGRDGCLTLEEAHLVENWKFYFLFKR